MKHIFFTTLMVLLFTCIVYASTNGKYVQYASNISYNIEKVQYYDKYGRPVPPPPVYYDKYGRPINPPKNHIDRRPAPPPVRPYVNTRPAPPPARPQIEVRPAPPPPPKR